MSEAMTVEAPAKRTRKEESTAKRVDAERRKMCNEMLARPDISRTQICQTLKMDIRTVNTICAEDMPEIAEAKVRVARLAYEATVYNLSAAAENAKNGKGSALEAKLSWDVYMGAMGEATQIIQHDHVFPQLSEFNKERLAEGSVVDV